MLTRESLGLIFDELGDADHIVAVFSGLVYPYPIGIVYMVWFDDRLIFLVDIGCRDRWICAWAARAGSLECLKYARSHGCPWDLSTSMNAARAGSLECLRYAHEHGCPWDRYTCTGAVKAGSLECLKYAHEHGCSWDKSTYREAEADAYFRGASSVCLEYLIFNGCYQ
jgi:hypothetical protein